MAIVITKIQKELPNPFELSWITQDIIVPQGHSIETNTKIFILHKVFLWYTEGWSSMSYQG
jgi:hypothetical protein